MLSVEQRIAPKSAGDFVATDDLRNVHGVRKCMPLQGMAAHRQTDLLNGTETEELEAEVRELEE
jgi:hypothetical protein